MIFTIADLDRHALAYRMRGFPVFGEPDPDSDESEVIGHIETPLVSLSDITGDAATELGRRYFAFLDERDEKRPGDPWLTDARCYWVVMEQNGVACYHPPHWRHREYQGAPLRDGFWCEACDAIIVAARP